MKALLRAGAEQDEDSLLIALACGDKECIALLQRPPPRQRLRKVGAMVACACVPCGLMGLSRPKDVLALLLLHKGRAVWGICIGGPTSGALLMADAAAFWALPSLQLFTRCCLVSVGG